MDFAAHLSPAQLEAATRLDVPVCVLAGAGSGKTRVIVHRIAYLILEKRVAPERILAVTFTNKAAGEMRERAGRLVPGRGEHAQVGTFHGIAARLLRRYGRAVGVNPSFVIYDDDDWQRLLGKIVVNDLNLSKDTTGPIARYLESWMAEGLAPDQVPTNHDLLFEWALKAYAISRERLDSMGALDFGGLLLKLRALVQSEAGPLLRELVRHVLVDEYQDVNRVQADIVLALGRGADSIAVVGDDDQAIYGWRGASAENLKRFLDAMPGALLVKLEENYRSTATILEAANGIIARNEVRLGKTLRPTGEPGRPVHVLRGRDDLEEARRVLWDMLDEIGRGTRLDQLAVLYRTNALSRPFEDALRQNQLPYRVVGGVRFYDRKEVKDVLATLRCALNPRSDVDTLRWLAAVPRGIGDTTVKKLEAAARRVGAPLLQALRDDALHQDAGLNAATRRRCVAAAAEISELAARISPIDAAARAGQHDLFAARDTAAPAIPSAAEAIALAIDASGIKERLEGEEGIEAEGRLENLEELVSAAAEWGEQVSAQGQPDDVIGFLESASLLSSADTKPDPRGQVTLMTLHAAKGLEFEVVYLAGLEESGFPHARALREGGHGDELEEERRLAYVGITRARRRLVLSYADVRMVNGQRKARMPSRFLTEIPRGVLDGDVPRRTMFDGDAPRGSLFGGAALPATPAAVTEARVVYDEPAPTAPRRTRLVLTEPDFVPPAAGLRIGEEHADEPAGAFAAGARVIHRDFGAGTVVGLRGSGARASALVRFDDERGPRVIIARYLRPQADPGLASDGEVE
ncbi:MAG: UvrD-helicase domain-containing protein [Deltaproteobacteria bacterium]|nr:UvrD-helicase domain-containing protein [Deltaproteobacteria bacterium]